MDKNNEKVSMEEHHLPQDVTHQTNSVDESRRRFTKSGLVVSGVLLTLASRPSLGGGLACKSPSGFSSANLSHHGSQQTCSGLTPGYWGNWGGSGPQANKWPSPYQPGTCKKNTTGNKPSDWSGGTLFKNVFNCIGNGSIYSSYSLMQVIWLTGGGDPNQLGAHIVAALLNAKSGLTPVLTVPQVINIFNEWNQNGYFSPTVGVKWYSGDIVTYLESTMS